MTKTKTTTPYEVSVIIERKIIVHDENKLRAFAKKEGGLVDADKTSIEECLQWVGDFANLDDAEYTPAAKNQKRRR